MVAPVSPYVYDVRFTLYSVISYLSWLIIFRLLSPRLSPRLVPSYSKLSQRDKLKWDSALVSQWFAFVVGGVTVYGFLADPQLYRDPIWGTSSVVCLECGMIIGYLTAHMTMMALEPAALYDVLYILHHVTALTTVTAVATSGACAFFLFYRFLHVLPNIFLNFLKLFNLVKMEKKSRLFLANGITFIVVFFLCRIVVMPGYYYAFLSFWSVKIQPPLYTFYVSGACGVIIDAMNFYWFYLVCKGFIKVISSTNREKNSISISTKS